MGGSVNQSPSDQLAMWLAIIGKSHALGGSPNPAETLRRIEEAQLLDAMRRGPDPRRIPPWVPGTTRSQEM